MSIGTFGAFTQARLAIYAAQTGLTVTGNNISNINTEGYTRQRLDQTSLYTVGSDRYYAEGDVRVGQGVLVKSLSQIRSPYLDIRFRKEAASVGYMDKMLDGLNRIAATLDEVGKGDQSKEEDGFGVLALEFDKIRDAIEHLTEQTGHQEYDSSVRAACDALAKKFNTYANKLQQTYDETINELHENVEAINGHLDTIRSLNEEIRKCDIHGDNALELRDERNLEIDKLSQLVGIRVDYSMEEFSYGVQVEKLTISLNDHNPDGSVTSDETVLIDGVYGSHISIDQVPQENLNSLKYLDDQGNPTADADKAAQVPKDNPNYDPAITDVTAPGFGKYLKDDGSGTNNRNLAAKVPQPNPNDKPYLKEDGTPTDDPAEARMVDSPNFNITVSELRNKAGYLLYKNSKSPEIMLDHTADAAEIAEALRVLADGGTKSEAAGNGDITITKYRQGLRENPDYSPLIPPYLDAKGKPVAKPVDPKNPIINPDYKPRYLDAAGKPTDDKAQAETVYYKTVITQVASKPVELDDNDLYGEIQAQRELLTEAGEFTDTDVISKDIQTGPYRNTDERAASKRGIQYYQRALDLLANQFANAMNEANQGFALDTDGNIITEEVTGTAEDLGLETDPNGYYIDDLGNYVATTAHAPCILNDFPLSANATEQEIQDYIAAHAPGDPDVTDLAGLLKKHGTQDPDAEVTAKRTIPMGGPLFSNNGATNDTENITAANISVSHMWQNTNNMLVRSYTCVPGTNEPASGDNQNLLHILHVMDVEKHDFIPSSLDSTKTGSDEIMFSGTFTDFWTEIGDVLGQDSSYTGTMLDTHYENALATDTNRDSVSAVDFNDEAMNLMMYAKSYNAACRLMTTIDSVLDKLVNNTGLTT